jgi:ubiquinone/menaquinone biosynthesis C-methylase UbiE
MTEAVTERVSRYILDGTDQDLRRLLSIAEVSADMARTAFRRVGLQPGWNAIDCGCGPIGGLTVLAEMVGPAGQVTGVDVNQAAIQRARAVVSAVELGNVKVVAGDLHELDATALDGPFDLAYTRCFLMHQTDPLRTLVHIAALLRPGGWLVAQEPLPSPTPRSHPHLDALTGYWDLIYELLYQAGVPAGAVENLPRSAREAGFEVAAISSSCAIADPELFETHAGTLTAARERATQLGIAAERIDDLARQIQAAKGGGYEWVTSPFYLDLTLRKPATA